MSGRETPRISVKICGIREPETLCGMDGLDVDYVGFVFAASRRRVTPAQAGELIAAARRTAMAGGRPPRAVGVFVDPTMEEIAGTLALAPLDAVQLHGAETPAFCRAVRERFGVEVWRSLPVEEPAAGAEAGAAGEAEAAAERIRAYAGAADAVLLDTAGGGTGRVFRWERIPACLEAARLSGLRLFVAGGLTPDNVAGLLRDYGPDGVDVSSGVETDGRKDIAKIAAFVERVKTR